MFSYVTVEGQKGFEEYSKRIRRHSLGKRHRGKVRSPARLHLHPLLCLGELNASLELLSVRLFSLLFRDFEMKSDCTEEM